MKALLLVVIVAIIGGLYMQTQRPIPTTAAISARAAQGPLLHFTGTISQHAPGGLLVSCVEWKPYLNKGHGREEVTGVFFVAGLPGETTLPDGRAVEFDGSPTGLYEYRTVLGVARNITRVAYAETGHEPYAVRSATPFPRPVSTQRRTGLGGN